MRHICCIVDNMLQKSFIKAVSKKFAPQPFAWVLVGISTFQNVVGSLSENVNGVFMLRRSWTNLVNPEITFLRDLYWSVTKVWRICFPSFSFFLEGVDQMDNLSSSETVRSWSTFCCAGRHWLMITGMV
jgi:hypothetical protein